MTTDTNRSAETAWNEWVHRTNPRLDRRGVHDAFIAGFARGFDVAESEDDQHATQTKNVPATGKGDGEQSDHEEQG